MLTRAHRSDESGSALVTVLIVMMVLGLLTVSLSAAVVNTTRTTVGVRGSLQAQAAADAGIAAAVAAAKANPSGVCTVASTSTTAPRYSVSTTCPSGTGRAIFRSTGQGEDGGSTTVEAAYQYVGGVAAAAPEYAMTIGGNGLSANSLTVKPDEGAGDSAALILSGDFMTCNNTTSFATDVVLYAGSIELTNSCTFEKSLYVSGNVRLNSSITVKGSIHALGTVSIDNSTVKVLGDINARGRVNVQGQVSGNVTTEGDLTMPSNGTIAGNATIGGNATLSSNAKINGTLTATGKATISGSTVGKLVAGGALDLNAATITGEIIGGSPEPAAMYNVKAGSILIAAPFKENFQASTVTGDVVSTRAGAKSFIAPDTKIGGALRLAGTASTGWGPPTATRGNSYNVTGLTAPAVPAKPTVPTPTPLQSGTAWEDYAYDAEQWRSDGYTIVTWPAASTCDFSKWTPANVAAINGYTTPTVVDLRGCGTVAGYQAAFSIKTDLVLLLADNGKTHDFQEAVISSGDGQPHEFTLFVPDATKNSLPTCSSSNSKVNLYAATLSSSPRISGLVYTPCILGIGIANGKGNWFGQFYVGSMTFGGSGNPGYQFVYSPILVPAFGDGAITPPSLGALLSRRDVG